MLAGFDTIRAAVKYQSAEGAEHDTFPFHQTVLHHATGEYVDMPGFGEDISGARSVDELPETAREYLRFVEDFVGVPITLIGVGPGRDQIIWTEAAKGMTVAIAA